jgi:hypothetical protein
MRLWLLLAETWVLRAPIDVYLPAYLQFVNKELPEIAHSPDFSRLLLRREMP